MEMYVTKRQFDYVLKELKRVQGFLAETFGTKFSDFECNDESILVQPTRKIVNRSGKISDVPGNGNANQIRVPVSKTDVHLGNKSFYNCTLIKSSANTPSSEFDDDNVPVVRSTMSLLSSRMQRVPSFSDASETVEIPIFPTSTVPVIASPTPTTSVLVSQNNMISTQELNSPSIGQLEQKQRSSKADSFFTNVQPPPTKRPKKAALQPRELHMYHPYTSSSTGSDNRDSPNDSVPIPIGIEPTIEESASGPKRLRLTSLRPRSLKLQSPVNTLTTSVCNDTQIIQCDLCNLFVYSSQLDSHMKNHSLVETKIQSPLKKPQICPTCGLRCIDMSMYMYHQSQIHPDDGFPCPVCKKQMNSKYRLKRHMSAHRNIKFECMVCGKAYNRSDNLSAHRRIHEGNKEVSTFYCSSCNTAFSSRAGRDKHLNACHPERQKSLGQTTHSEADDSSSENEGACTVSRSSPVTQAVTDETVKPDAVDISPVMAVEVKQEKEDDPGL